VYLGIVAARADRPDRNHGGMVVGEDIDCRTGAEITASIGQIQCNIRFPRVSILPVHCAGQRTTGPWRDFPELELPYQPPYSVPAATRSRRRPGLGGDSAPTSFSLHSKPRFQSLAVPLGSCHRINPMCSCSFTQKHPILPFPSPSPSTSVPALPPSPPSLTTLLPTSLSNRRLNNGRKSRNS
jgi:hypothetical protein